MFALRCCGAVLCASIALAWGGAARAAGGGTFGEAPSIPPPAAAPEPAFEAMRKPPIPVSFLAHDGGWIQFLYPPSARDRTAPLIAHADDLRAELAEVLGQTPLDGVEIRVARGPEEMATLAPQGFPPASGALGIAYPKLRLVVLSLGSAGSSDLAELQGAFRRELSRLALVEAVSERPIPAWFVEGFTRYFSKDAEWEREWILYRAAMRHRTRPGADLDAMLDAGGTEASLASAEAAGLVDFLLKPAKRGEFAATVDRLRLGDTLEGALVSGYGSSLEVIERQWRAELNRRTTVSTVVSSVGLPSFFFVVWGAFRLVRRQRSRVRAAKQAGQPPPRPGITPDEERVHIVLSRRDDRFEPPLIAEAEIPKVEHEGEWHTLH